jgi:hypothetical protein
MGERYHNKPERRHHSHDDRGPLFRAAVNGCYNFSVHNGRRVMTQEEVEREQRDAAMERFIEGTEDTADSDDE